jgi:esterase/lipase superfamily enzyme
MERTYTTAVSSVLVLALASLLSGCAKPLLTCPREMRLAEPPPPDQHPAAVLFATDRLPESAGDLTFSPAMNLSGTRVTYGARCADPERAGRTTCDEPGWLQAKMPAALEKDRFFQSVTAANSDVVLFVHGFNYSFQESLDITARLVQRAATTATPVAYAWPSQARISAYGLDYDRNEWTIEHLRDFIQDLVHALPPGAVLHIVSQSMGNRAVLWALSQMDLPEHRLGQLIMIAPDVDTDIFKDLISRSGPFQRKTLYVSKHDLALQAAGLLRSGVARAGDARKQFLVIKEMDTIDASPLKAGFVGHSVYDYSQLLFNDLGATLANKPVSARELQACTVKSIDRYNAEHGTQLPCVVYRLPRN